MIQSIRRIFLQHKFVVTALALILVAGFILRVWDLGSQSLWIDEGFTLNAALATVENGYPLLASGEFYKNSWLYVYITAGVIKIAGLDPFNPWAVRLPSVFLGLGVIGMAFFLSRLLFKNTGLALLVATLMALSYWEIDWSRQVRGYAGLQFFILGALFYLYRWLESKNIRHQILFGIFFILAYLHHTLAIVFVPAIAIAVVAYHILHPKLKMRRQHIILGALSLAALAFATLHYGLVNLNRITYDYSGYYATFLFGSLAPITYAALGGIGLGIFDKKRFWPVMFVAIHVLFPLAFIMFYGEVANLRYLFPFFPLMVILSLYAVFRAAEIVPGIKKVHAWIGIAIVTTFLFSGQITLKPKNFYQSEFDSPRPDFETAYSIIRESRSDTDIILSPYAHMTNIYLGETGYWLPISFNGVRRRLEANIIDGAYDRYVYAPAVIDRNHLIELLDERHGFIVVDGMASFRLGPLLPIIIEHPKVAEIFQNGKARLNNIRVYRF